MKDVLKSALVTAVVMGALLGGLLVLNANFHYQDAVFAASHGNKSAEQEREILRTWCFTDSTVLYKEPSLAVKVEAFCKSLSLKRYE